MENGNGWDKWKELVIYRLESLDDRVDKVNWKIDAHREDEKTFQMKVLQELSTLKTKSRIMWGMGSGIAAAIVTLVVRSFFA